MNLQHLVGYVSIILVVGVFCTFIIAHNEYTTAWRRAAVTYLLLLLLLVLPMIMGVKLNEYSSIAGSSGSIYEGTLAGAVALASMMTAYLVRVGMLFGVPIGLGILLILNATIFEKAVSWFELVFGMALLLIGVVTMFVKKLRDMKRQS